ncbi:MAG: Rpn family recombination-promoting nuclease/putative transposase [Clostridiales bacterium]|nr:Rpn family recombination-promoting nuclease/putative transposase [Clostridiales bacterium]
MELSESDYFGSANEDSKAEVNPELFFPLYNEVFKVWMGDKTICGRFIEAVAGKKVTVSNIRFEMESREEFLGSKRTRLDIVAEEGDYAIYDVEAQRDHLKDHKNRCVFYGCRKVSKYSLKKGETYSKLRPVTIIFINLENPEAVSYIDDIRFRYESSNCYRVYNNGLRIVEFNLDKIDEMLKDKHAKDDIKFFALACKIGSSSKHLKEFCKKHSINFPELIQLLEIRYGEMRNDPDIVSAVNNYIAEEGYPYKEGKDMLLSEIEQRGIEKGKAEGRISTAVKALEQGYSIDAVKGITELPAAFLTKLTAASNIPIDRALEIYFKEYITD